MASGCSVQMVVPPTTSDENGSSPNSPPGPRLLDSAQKTTCRSTSSERASNTATMYGVGMSVRKTTRETCCGASGVADGAACSSSRVGKRLTAIVGLEVYLYQTTCGSSTFR